MSLRRLLAAVASVALFCMHVSQVSAQSADCQALNRRIEALGRDDATRYARARRQQRTQIERTLAFSRAYGCDEQPSSLFAAPESEQCTAINTRLRQMNANLQALQEAEANSLDGRPEQRAELIARFETACGSNSRVANAQPTLRDEDDDRPGDRDAVWPRPEEGRRPAEPGENGRGSISDEPPTEMPPTDTPASDDTAAAVLGGSKAVCVKTCDGAFFPVSYTATAGTLHALEAMCQAQCPNAETKLFTYDIDTEIDRAVDKEGRPYSEMPNAKRYEKAFDRTCSCRAAGKSWVETLAEAERLYGADQHDVVVTQSMSDALARATSIKTAGRSSPALSRSARARKIRALANARADEVIAGEARTAAQVPTAGENPSGIARGATYAEGRHESANKQAQDAASPDAAARRRVRNVAPNL